LGKNGRGGNGVQNEKCMVICNMVMFYLLYSICDVLSEDFRDLQIVMFCLKILVICTLCYSIKDSRDL